MPVDTTLSSLVINKLTTAQYEELVENHQINENELYLTTDVSYPTQQDMETALAGKQDSLTAGTGIDITNNVISATANVSIDGETITRNTNNELQAVGVENVRDDSFIGTWQGTEQQWAQAKTTTWKNWKTNGIVQDGSIYYQRYFKNIGYDGETFFGVYSSSSPYVFVTSLDGITWSGYDQSMDVNVGNVNCPPLYKNGYYYIANDNCVYRSSNGINWVLCTEYSNPFMPRCIISLGNTIVVSGYGQTYFYSTDSGETWVKSSFPAYPGNYSHVNIACDGTKIVGVSKQYVYISTDGINWTTNAITFGTNSSNTRIQYGNGRFVCVTDSKTTAYSLDGENWVYSDTQIWNTYGIVESLTFANGTFLCAGDSGNTWYSGNGVTWTKVTAYSEEYPSATWTYDPTAVCGAKDKFLIATTYSTGGYGVFPVSLSSCYTTDVEPTTSSVIYSEPNITSALTVTTGGSSSIILSDDNTYNRNSAGDETTYQTAGSLYPDHLAFVNGVGVKKGNTVIANYNVQEQADWNQTNENAVDYIKNKPTIPAAQVNADWNASSGVAEILNKPTIPTVNDGVLTITQGGTLKGTFSANSSNDTTIDIDASVSIDNLTITENSLNELQASAVMNKKTGVNALPLWQGTQQEWEQAEITDWRKWQTDGIVSDGVAITSTENITSSMTYDGNQFLAFSKDGNFYSSINGTVWENVSNPEFSNIYSLKTLNDIYYVRASGKLYKSEDSGANWTELVTNSLLDFEVTSERIVMVSNTSYSTSSDGGSTWQNGSLGPSDGYISRGKICYEFNKFFVTNSKYLYSSYDGINWDYTLLTDIVDDGGGTIVHGNQKIFLINSSNYACTTDGVNWITGQTNIGTLGSILYGDGTYFCQTSNYGQKYSCDCINWTAVECTKSGTYPILMDCAIGAIGDNKVISVSSHWAGNGILSFPISSSSCYTTTTTPDTTSTVYSAPNTTSALTITSVGTGTITLSDTNVYNRQAGGDTQTYQDVASLYPTSLAFVNDVGIKIGNTLIADYTDTSGLQPMLTAGTGMSIVGNTISTTATTLHKVANTTVQVSDFIADSQYTDYNYRADVTVTGITANDYPTVIFSPEDSISNNFARFVESGNGYVSIWCKTLPEAAITIPTITYE